MLANPSETRVSRSSFLLRTRVGIAKDKLNLIFDTFAQD